MKVKDLMMSRNLVTARPDDSLFLVGQLMQWRGVRHVPVLDEVGGVVGIVSERDLVEIATEPAEHDRFPIREIMRKPVEVVTPGDDIAVAAAAMASRKIGCVAVVTKGKLVGILTATDVVGHAVSTRMGERSRVGAPVGTIMRRNVVTVGPQDDLMEAVDLMVEREVRHLPVIDASRRVVGMLSDRDMRTAMGDPVEAMERWAASEDGRLRRVSEAMTPDPITARAEETAGAVALKLANQRVGAVPIVDGEKCLLGIVSYVDLLRSLHG